ncbi:hypothetical protein [Cognatilysobacter segetis]|uniref:hypothetical protein n=1 Tax=Cognatilysobacter segetis TaxID=2492394 RepID=UPI00105CE10B|nr:hypothetical protein [Lysobacter segetis]
MRRIAACALLAVLVAGHASAQALQLHGFVDLRAVSMHGDDDRWVGGGLGKARTDAANDGLTGGGALVADWQATPSLLATASAQYVPGSSHPLDVIDASLRWRPVSTTPWRASLKAGMFFAPVSLENDALGWTSPYTLTPSAIDTWVGEELRTFGAEGRLEHRGMRGTLAAGLGLFAKNDPAGELLATRGWAMHDLVTGLDARLREPDAFAPGIGTTAPVYFRPFLEIDHRLGAYALLDWRTPAQDRATLLVYDNRADPTRDVDYAGRELYAWRTRFWSAGGQRRFGEYALLAQLMRGSTIVEPAPGLRLDTHFAAGYLMAAREAGRWRPAARVDLFRTARTPALEPATGDEHGRALTLALGWRPRDDLRVTGEVLHIDSTRAQRRLEGREARQHETQVQASLRWLF